MARKRPTLEPASTRGKFRFDHSRNGKKFSERFGPESRTHIIITLGLKKLYIGNHGVMYIVFGSGSSLKIRFGGWWIW